MLSDGRYFPFPLLVVWQVEGGGGGWLPADERKTAYLLPQPGTTQRVLAGAAGKGLCQVGRSRPGLLCAAEWMKGCEFESRQERRENFLLQSWLCVLTLVRCPFHPYVTAVARKRPRPFCQKRRWQVTPNTHTPLTQRSRSGLTIPLSRQRVGTYAETSSHATCQGTFRPQSSQLAEPLWTDPGIKSGISVRELISISKKKKKALAGNEWLNFLPQSSQARKKTNHLSCRHKIRLQLQAYTLQRQFNFRSRKTEGSFATTKSSLQWQLKLSSPFASTTSCSCKYNRLRIANTVGWTIFIWSFSYATGHFWSCKIWPATSFAAPKTGDSFVVAKLILSL